MAKADSEVWKTVHTRYLCARKEVVRAEQHWTVECRFASREPQKSFSKMLELPFVHLTECLALWTHFGRTHGVFCLV